MKLLFLLLLFFCSVIENSCAQSAFKDSSDEKKVQAIFNTYKNIDSLNVVFFNNIPSLLYVDEPLEAELADTGNKKKLTIYYLNFEGDQFWLRKKYNLLNEFVSQKDFIFKVEHPGQGKEFRILLTRKGSKVVDRAYSSASGPGAVLNSKRKQDFIRLLNQNYTTKKVPAADSILIIQFATTRDGTLGQYEILYGHKGSSLYKNFLKTYAEFNSTLPKERYPATKGLVLPKMQNGERVGLIDFFIRLNPDRTFTVSAQGNDRDLKIKDFKNDPDNPLFL
ncbi:hypothetical protein [Sphingobacterium athyrii]|uniref:DUF5117 domain-containing protein n=1 Tax=Sphingobacterium athyrii TaxID=2152717 RepID=A0A363NWD9_9SPHI|nr:hypothetical protein [Sphingobacterium athyrii]PUV25099.1 hypothetical protein DCO56_09155 [Sphingobacterium athyrii]